MARTAVERAERAAYWRRKPWPAVLLGVDPGETAGACIAIPYPPANHKQVGMEGGPCLHWVKEVKTPTRQVEEVIGEAARIARVYQLKLVLVLEEWGAGGPLGIKTWLGMGAAAGAWTRAVGLAAKEECGDMLTASRCILRVPQTRWRSWCIEESGTREGGKFRRYDSEKWKRAATRTAAEQFPHIHLQGSNAAEAALLTAYASRCDELGHLLPSTYLRARGFEPPPALVTKGRAKK